MTETAFTLKTGLAEMLKGGVIMDVTTADQAKIAENAGAVAVMALERVPADIRAQGGVARMADPTKIKNHAGCFYPRDGQSAHWAFCRSPDFAGDGGGLYLRERSAHPGG